MFGLRRAAVKIWWIQAVNDIKWKRLCKAGFSGAVCYLTNDNPLVERRCGNCILEKENEEKKKFIV